MITSIKLWDRFLLQPRLLSNVGKVFTLVMSTESYSRRGVSTFRILFRFQKIVCVISVCPSPFIDTGTCCNGSLWRWYERGRYRGVSPFSYFSLFSLLPPFLSVYPRPYSPFSPFLPSPSSLSAVSPPLLPLSRPPAPPSETYSLPAKQRFRPVHRGERGCNR